jgi:hypothetical protein
MRIEASVMTSLHELKAIEQERVADERAAFERSRAAEIDARIRAEKDAAAAVEARQRAEREERIRIEEARVAAEREARMRVEATEAAERARQHAMLEQQRLEQEIELRRAEVAKQRPTWMLAVTGLALAAGIGLAWFAIDRAQASEVAAQQEKVANDRAKKADDERAKAATQLAAMQQELTQLDTRVKKAIDDVIIAQNDADRRRAKDQLVQLQREQYETQKRIEEQRKKAFDVERKGGVHFGAECTNTALGCIEHH